MLHQLHGWEDNINVQTLWKVGLDSAGYSSYDTL